MYGSSGVNGIVGVVRREGVDSVSGESISLSSLLLSPFTWPSMDKNEEAQGSVIGAWGSNHRENSLRTQLPLGAERKNLSV